MKAIYSKDRIEEITIETIGKGLGRGATANVYSATNSKGDTFAAKIYHDKNSIDVEKLKNLILHNPIVNLNLTDKGYDFTWPIALLSETNRSRDSVGFLMRKVEMNDSFPLSSSFVSPIKQSSKNPHWPLNLRVLIANQ